ncbi:katanin p80 WD40 repeat-containing subunit B1-like [Sinocyclocheilus grahami]|uniref:katanin p80 WD40 repeat-containing subunit B1-like n=1 Tax=Sinocyclocheilus grahami TaxID=75366 RepID=UPI0007AD2900|nr:PREDICTED: katanin p80 WD40 repeat-containing subunit B1-like [Sinocyclocheilus grahami]
MALTSTTITSWKLQEIVAHSSNVSSLVLGKSSGRLLATGGEDCRVNIWAVSKPNCIMSLTGHTSPVECIQFNSSEERVVAGSQSGSLRLWDLEAAKILRTLMGHKASICSLDFHPMGEYLASGSVDSNIKLWDVRRKGCVFRYKGHTQAVRCLAFSPDGKWLASASDDSTVKLWDLIAGKMITEFPLPLVLWLYCTSVTSPSRPVVTATKSKPSTGIILSTRNEPIGLTAGDFLSHARNAKAGVMGDDEALAQIRKGHDTMCVMLTSRYKNLDTVRSVWASGDVKTSLDSAVSMNDLSIVVDILNIINLKPSLWKLDLCTSILPQIEELLQSKYESYVQTGCMALKLILKRFWPLISDTLTAPPSVGVDITREERHQKCKACYKQLKNLSNVVKNRAEQVGRHGSTFKELQLLMAPLDY